MMSPWKECLFFWRCEQPYGLSWNKQELRDSGHVVHAVSFTSYNERSTSHIGGTIHPLWNELKEEVSK